ncbi:DUF5331 domain-containing protein, partial [Tychonema sp. BBK16]
MAFFDTFSVALKQKWLDYYQANRAWLLLHMTADNTVATPDGGKRPVSYLILGIAAALEPELQQLMLPFSKLKPDADSLIEVLGLNFDPDLALGMPSDTIQPAASQSLTVAAPKVATAATETLTAAPAAAPKPTAPAATPEPTAPAATKSNQLGAAVLAGAGVVAGVAGATAIASALSSSDEESLEGFEDEEEAISDFDMDEDEEDAVSDFDMDEDEEDAVSDFDMDEDE